MSTPLRILIVDDSALYRKIVRDVLKSLPDIEVVGTANNGRIALDKIELLKPDLLTLDLEMPELDGIGLLRELSTRGSKLPAIMISAFTTEGAVATTTALRLGAFDFVLKPQTTSMEESRRLLREDLSAKLKACQTRVTLRRVAAGSKALAAPAPASPAPTQTAAAPRVQRGHPEIIGIGVSTGGPQALTELLPQLPADLPCPVLIVQHMPALFTKSLADDLNKRCRLEVREAVHGEPVLSGSILIAPGGKQMKVVRAMGSSKIVITDDPPVKHCKPSVDYLFRSLADGYGPNSMGIILTGMGEDGAEGSRQMHDRGAMIVAQDEASCVVYGMPRKVIEEGTADSIIPLSRIAMKIQSTVCRGATV